MFVIVMKDKSLPLGPLLVAKYCFAVLTNFDRLLFAVGFIALVGFSWRQDGRFPRRTKSERLVLSLYLRH